MRPAERSKLRTYPKAAVRPARSHRLRLPVTYVAALAIGAGLLTACKHEQRMVGQEARAVVVQTVTQYGLTLDESADPRMVAYVLLRAIKDDIEAGDDIEAREAAFDRQLALSAPDTIFDRSVRTGLGRDENVRRIVWHWAPTLGHYKDDFPLDWPAAEQRMVQSPVRNAPDQGNWTRVFIELADPSGDPNASVVAQVQLVREGGYWRVVQVGFKRGTRQLFRGTTASKTIDDS